MKLLLVTHAYRPAPNPRAFRWSAIAEHWARAGHAVDVVCAPAVGRYEDVVLEGVRVHTAAGLGGRLRRALLRRGERPEAGGPHRRALVSPWAAAARVPAIRRIYDATWKQLYWPDYACTWYAAARRRTLQLLAGNRYDGLITVSVPFTGHLVGYAAHKRHPELPWLVDIGDPFSFVAGASPNNQRLYGRLNHTMERRVFAAADAVAVTTEGTRHEYAALFGESAHKVSVIPPLLSLPAGGAAESAPFLGDRAGRLRLVFIGTFYSAIRSPAFLLDLFRALLRSDPGDRLELHLVGNTHDCADLIARHADLLGSRLFVHGLVERQAAHAAMCEADVLVNVGNDNSYQLPSKVVEYMSTGKPILNLIAGEDDSSHQLLRTYPRCFALSNAAPPSAERLRALVDFLRSPPVSEPDAVARATAPFRTEAVSDAYEALLRGTPGAPRAARSASREAA